MNKYIVIDAETTIKCPIGSNKASPFWPANKIVVIGWFKEGRERIEQTTESYISFSEDNYLYVGQNIPFDLMHLYKSSTYSRKKMATRQIWDIGLVEYILTGQQMKWPSLDELSEKYGLPRKSPIMKAYWEAGTQTEDIPIDQLKEYNAQDVNNTHEIFKKQFEIAYKAGKLPLIKSQMEALLGYTDMMWNGMKVDAAYLVDGISGLKDGIRFIEDDYRYAITSQTDVPDDLIDIASPKSVSLCLFGGEVKYKERELQGKYKNGNDKWKLVEKTKSYKGCAYIPEKWGAEKGKLGYYLVPDKVLSAMSAAGLWPAELIEGFREASKDLGTYYEPTKALIMPDGCIHHNINPTATNTGRTSSSEPNLQNVTDKSKSEIKRAYVSRWGKDGKIVEADYGQLEIVILAYLSQDHNLIHDLNNGVDIHSKLFAEMFGRAPSADERKVFKRLSFGLVYGAGAPKLAEGAKVDKTTASLFIETFHNNYPEVKVWWAKIAEVVVIKNRIPNSFHENGYPIATSHLVMPTGRVLKFREYEIPWYPRRYGFSPTEMKNYPVQSLATADIVPMIIGKLFREINNGTFSDRCSLINTIHDSIVFDVHNDVFKEAIELIKRVMNNVAFYLETDFNIKDFNVHYKVNITAGENWHEQNEVR